MARVLLVGKGPPERGGIPTFLRMLLDSGLERAHEVRFLNLTRPETTEGGRWSIQDLARTARDALEVWRRSGDEDVVHIHSALAPLVTLLRAGFLGLAARARGSAVVIHAHGGRIQLWMKGTLRHLAARAALAPATRVVAVSEGSRAALAPVVRRGGLVLIQNGVEIEKYSLRDAENEPPRILYVGLLTRRKGVLDLLAASALLSSRGIDHELWLAGGSTSRGADDAEAAARDAGTARLLGERPLEAMPALYGQADLFCLPSWWEAMPLSVLEAMAAGLPVVASRVGDVPRIVEDGVTGLLVPPGDQAALAGALETLLLDAGLRRRMARAARKRVRARYTAAATIEALDEMYSELAAKEA